MRQLTTAINIMLHSSYCTVATAQNDRTLSASPTCSRFDAVVEQQLSNTWYHLVLKQPDFIHMIPCGRKLYGIYNAKLFG